MTADGRSIRSAAAAVLAVLRVERRAVRRARGRAVLVVLLVALPVAALVGGSTLLATVLPTSAERTTELLGTGTLRIDAPNDVRPHALAALPDDAVVEHTRIGAAILDAGELRLRARCHAAAADGMAAAMLRLVDGRAPRAAHEVALSPDLIRLGDLALGDSIDLRAFGGVHTRATVVGTVVSPEALTMPTVWTALDARTPTDSAGSTIALVDLPPDVDVTATAAAVRAASADRARVVVATAMRSRPPFESAGLLLLGGLGFVEAALVVAAAFAIGLRRRRREIGLLAATGAAPADVVRAVTGSATILAAIGCVLGALVGIGAVAALMPWLSRWTDRDVGTLDVDTTVLVGAVVIGMVTAGIAAWWPARHAVGVPVRVALSSRRPPDRVGSGRWLVVGGLAIVAGVVLTTVAPRLGDAASAVAGLGGAVLGVLGLGACSPWLLDTLARRATPLPTPWRLAVRDAGRYRDRNGPVVTAVLASTAVSVTAAVTIASLGADDAIATRSLRDDHVLVHGPAAERTARSLAEALDVVAAAPLHAARIDGLPVRARIASAPAERFGWVAVGGAELLETLGAAASLGTSSNGIVAIAHAIPDGERIELVSTHDWRILTTCPAVDSRCAPRLDGPAFVLSPSQADALGLEVGPPPRADVTPWLLRLTDVADHDVVHLARTIAEQRDGRVGADATIDARMLQTRTVPLLFAVTLLLSLLIGVGVIAVATALTGVESRPDREVLTALGAPPRLDRHLTAARASYLALLGCALALPAGALPAFGIVAAFGDIDIVVPWLQVGLAIGALPAVTWLGTWCVTRPLRTRDVSLGRRGDDE